MPRFQAGDGMADGRLRQVERAGGLGHMLAFGDGHENPELLQGHGKRPIQSKNKIISRYNIH